MITFNQMPKLQISCEDLSFDKCMAMADMRSIAVHIICCSTPVVVDRIWTNEYHEAIPRMRLELKEENSPMLSQSPFGCHIQLCCF